MLITYRKNDLPKWYTFKYFVLETENIFIISCFIFGIRLVGAITGKASSANAYISGLNIYIG